ncbi:MATE efflux family protein [Apiospora arundinis]
MPLVLRYNIATIRDGAVLNSDSSNTLSGVAKSTATGIITTASTTPIPSDRTNTSFLHRVDLTPPEISWFDSQASWPLALIPLVFTILLTICLIVVSGSRRERILGVRNPANERVL